MSEETETPQEPVVRDRRRIDPETGQPRGGAPEQPAPAAGCAPAARSVGGPDDGAADTALEAAQALAAERLEELQRLNAEYVN